MKVQLKPGNGQAADYRDLTSGKTYEVIGIEADDLRLLNDEGLPYLYPRELFGVVDPSEPEVWETTYGEEGERYSYPRELGRPGFFEDYFDGDPEAVEIFRNFLEGQERTSPNTTRN